MEIQSPGSEPRCPATSRGRCLVLVQAHEGRFVLVMPPDLEIRFQGLVDSFNMMLWNTHLTTGHQEDPFGRPGFKNGDRKEE